MADIQPFVDKGLIDQWGGGMNPGMWEFGGKFGDIGGAGWSSFMSNNPGMGDLLGGALGAGAGALGMFLNKQQGLPFGTEMGGAASMLGGEAANLYGYGSALRDPMVSGKLLPGQEQMVQNAIKQATDTSKARFASLGQTGSTMEGDTLANIQNQATAMRAQIAQSDAQIGLQATQESIQALGLESGIYGKMMEAQMKQDSDMSSSISSFASSIGKFAAAAAPFALALL
jgi:hypothetical protein